MAPKDPGVGNPSLTECQIGGEQQQVRAHPNLTLWKDADPDIPILLANGVFQHPQAIALKTSRLASEWAW